MGVLQFTFCYGALINTSPVDRSMNAATSRRNNNCCSLFVLIGCIISFRNTFLVLKKFYGENSYLSLDTNVITIIGNTSTFAEIRHVMTKEYNHELIKQNFSSDQKGSETAAGCLLVMDDNHFLIEWIAYHYHVVNLRHLIVAIDPRSQTLPDEIVQRWKNHMNISVWYNYNDYNLHNQSAILEAEERVRIVLQNAKEPYNYDLIQHRARQRLFYSQCMMKHQQASAHHGWTLFLDTDEFVSINYPMLSSLRPFYDMNNIPIPSISEPGSVLKLLQLEQDYFNFNEEAQQSNNITSSPCIQIPRFRYGIVEMPKSPLHYNLPATVNASHYATLRWQIHAKTNNYGMNRISKTIIDLRRISSDELYDNFPIVESIHKPLPMHCTRRKLHIRSTQQIFVIHHYLGTYEQYTFRKDSRGRNERSEKVRLILNNTFVFVI
jgi:hypothetical protein